MTPREEERIAQVARLWSIDSFPNNPGVDASLQMHEGLLHEVCHGLAIDTRLDKNTPARVSDHFESLNGQSKVLGLLHEARVIAIEAEAIPLLGWSRRVRPLGLLRTIWKIGHSGQALSFKNFQMAYRHFRREDFTAELGELAADKMKSFARNGARRSW